MPEVPQYHAFFNPLLTALRQLGGSGSISEIEEKVAEVAHLSDEVLAIMHGDSNRTKFSYRLAWTRTFLKKTGYITNSSQGVWVLTQKGREIEEVVPAEVVRQVREQMDATENTLDEQIEESDSPETASDELWQEKLLSVLQQMEPDAFERLCQRLLREAGFIHVEVTGRTGDGGIDGKGMMRLGGFLSFYIVFQCKRYTGSVGADKIRDFRGAMMGRAEKGLMITTGTFTRDAKKEASREGAMHVDLIDGEVLVERLKQFDLGVIVTQKERVDIDEKSILEF